MSGFKVQVQHFRFWERWATTIDSPAFARAFAFLFVIPAGICFFLCRCLCRCLPIPRHKCRVPHPSRTCDGWETTNASPVPAFVLPTQGQRCTLETKQHSGPPAKPSMKWPDSLWQELGLERVRLESYRKAHRINGALAPEGRFSRDLDFHHRQMRDISWPVKRASRFDGATPMF